MPFPIGHTAIGLAAYETAQSKPAFGSRTACFLYITLLTNLPDLDILAGLMIQGNGAAYHRGPTHSLLFALLFGFLASRAWRLWRRIPRFGFGLCSLLIFSHVAADMLLTSSPVSLLWPFEIYWSPEHSTWGEVVDMVLFQGIQDAGIAVIALLYVMTHRFVRGMVQERPLFAFAGKRSRHRRV
jgi:membrane-bound metal-dependent hydrolase YbcI (DUF457 family)